MIHVTDTSTQPGDLSRWGETIISLGTDESRAKEIFMLLADTDDLQGVRGAWWSPMAGHLAGIAELYKKIDGQWVIII